MPAASREQVVVEAFVKVRFVVTVEVVQPCDLIAPDDVGITVEHLQAKRLKQAGGKAVPCDFPERGVDAFNSPDVAMHRRNQRGAIRQKVMTGGK